MSDLSFVLVVLNPVFDVNHYPPRTAATALSPFIVSLVLLPTPRPHIVLSLPLRAKNIEQ